MIFLLQVHTGYASMYLYLKTMKRERSIVRGMKTVNTPIGVVNIDSMDDYDYYVRKLISDDFADCLKDEIERQNKEDDGNTENDAIYAVEESWQRYLGDVRDELESILHRLNQIESERLGPVKFRNLYGRLNILAEDINSRL